MTLTSEERATIVDVEELFNRLQSDEIVDLEPSSWRVWMLDNAKIATKLAPTNEQ